LKHRCIFFTDPWSSIHGVHKTASYPGHSFHFSIIKPREKSQVSHTIQGSFLFKKNQGSFLYHRSLSQRGAADGWTMEAHVSPAELAVGWHGPFASFPLPMWRWAPIPRHSRGVKSADHAREPRFGLSTPPLLRAHGQPTRTLVLCLCRVGPRLVSLHVLELGRYVPF
jgi:hypothetical protein